MQSTANSTLHLRQQNFSLHSHIQVAE